jgi:hypothetical protein
VCESCGGGAGLCADVGRASGPAGADNCPASTPELRPALPRECARCPACGPHLAGRLEALVALGLQDAHHHHLDDGQGLVVQGVLLRRQCAGGGVGVSGWSTWWTSSACEGGRLLSTTPLLLLLGLLPMCDAQTPLLAAAVRSLLRRAGRQTSWGRPWATRCCCCWRRQNASPRTGAARRGKLPCPPAHQPPTTWAGRPGR